MLKNAYSYGQREYLVVPTNVFPAVLYQLFCFMRCLSPFDYQVLCIGTHQCCFASVLNELWCHPVLDMVMPILSIRLSSFYFYHLFYNWAYFLAIEV